jgi:hypothetical protein
VQLFTMAVHIQSAPPKQSRITPATEQALSQHRSPVHGTPQELATNVTENAVFLYTLRPGCASSSFAVRPSPDWALQLSTKFAVRAKFDTWPLSG